MLQYVNLKWWKVIKKRLLMSAAKFTLSFSSLCKECCTRHKKAVAPLWSFCHAWTCITLYFIHKIAHHSETYHSDFKFYSQVTIKAKVLNKESVSDQIVKSGETEGGNCWLHRNNKYCHLAGPHRTSELGSFVWIPKCHCAHVWYGQITNNITQITSEQYKRLPKHQLPVKKKYL